MFLNMDSRLIETLRWSGNSWKVKSTIFLNLNDEAILYELLIVANNSCMYFRLSSLFFECLLIFPHSFMVCIAAYFIFFMIRIILFAACLCIYNCVGFLWYTHIQSSFFLNSNHINQHIHSVLEQSVIKQSGHAYLSNLVMFNEPM